MKESPTLEIKVWGPWACFTRPEMKAERVSYPVMTPSAARGILEAVFWKPEFSWRVKEIWVLNEINYFSVVRNEVNKKASVSVAEKWAAQGGNFFADDEDNRAQRHTLALRDVAYLIKADQQVKPHATEDPAKWREQFLRRVSKGQCFHRPYLGCREFAAIFSEPDGSEKPIPLNESLGQMLFDITYEPNKSGKGPCSGKGVPVFFQPSLQSGVLKVPVELYRS